MAELILDNLGFSRRNTRTVTHFITLLMVTIIAASGLFLLFDRSSRIPDPGGFIVAGTSLPSSMQASVAFSTFIGTSPLAGNSYEGLREAVVDSQGNIIVVGMGGFSPSGYQGVPVYTFGTWADGSSILVAKLNPEGSQLLWVTILGGSGGEKGGYGVALDPNDNIYVAGTTHSTDFPTTPGAWDRTPNSVTDQNGDAFLFKLSPDGSNLIYSTYLGGNNHESARGGLVVDDQGYAYVVGDTKSPDFLDEGGVPNPAKVNSFLGGENDGMIVKVSPDGSDIIYARYLGSSGSVESVIGVRVDSLGVAHVHGHVGAGDMITTADAFDRTFNGVSDGYYARISSDGRTLLYSTYIGGSGGEYAEHRIFVDNAGNAVMCGGTNSTDFPVVNGHQAASGDIYLVKFDSAGQLAFSTYIGRAGDASVCGGPYVDQNGNIYIVGDTDNPAFETTSGAWDTSFNGVQDVFLQVYDPNGSLLYSTLLGGTDLDRGRFVTLDQAGNPILVGLTRSADYPISTAAFDKTFNGDTDVFATKLEFSGSPDPTPGPTPTPSPTPDPASLNIKTFLPSVRHPFRPFITQHNWPGSPMSSSSQEG